jgi:UDP-N-acetylmuramoyl-tripeptide--D-alanyl-D-alanine ligase
LCSRSVHPRVEGLPLGPLVVVDDVTVAVQKLATRVRDRWAGWVIAVTGSAGKTTTKELVSAVLSTAGPVLRTTGNLNNHWGLPITMLGLEPAHKAAVLEMGMNHAGEIAALAAIAHPNACVITNAGSAHLEHLGSLDAIAREKASLAFALKPGEPAFVGADSPRLLAASSRTGSRARPRCGRTRSRTWGPRARGSRSPGSRPCTCGSSACTRSRTRSPRSRWRAT